MGAKQVEGLLVERLDGELIVVNPSTQEAHALNEAAAIVFELCDGETDRAAMAAEVGRRTGLPADESVVDLTLADLVEAGLVALDEPQDAAITRRTLIRRLALPAAAVALLPIVETVLVPSRASGQSPPTPTTTTTITPTTTTSTTPTPTPTTTTTTTTTETSEDRASAEKSTSKKRPSRTPTPKR